MDDSPRLQLIRFAELDAFENMALDLHLLRLCEDGRGSGFLRFYTWTRPTLSLGHFEETDVIDAARAQSDGVDIVRRPTGGRVVLHGDDLTYAIVLPKGPDTGLTETYRMISECLVRGMSHLGLAVELQRGIAAKTEARRKPCFVSASRYEITYRGRKLVGSAQKVGSASILQHGSIALGPQYLDVALYMACDDVERAVLRRDTQAATCCLHELLPSKPDARTVASALIKGFSEMFVFTGDPREAEVFEEEVAPIAESLKSSISGP
jgi:lipoate-protein ligase A